MTINDGNVPTYYEVFNGKALMAAINYQFVAFDNDNVDLMLLNTIGDRRVSPVVYRTLPDNFTSVDLATLGSMISMRYSKKWDRQKLIYNNTYDAMYNYFDELTETISDTSDNTSTSTNTSSVTGTNSKDETATRSITDTKVEDTSKNSTNTLSGESENTISDNNTETLKVNGFNSTTAVDSNQNVTVGSKTDLGTISNTNTIVDTVDSTVTDTASNSLQSTIEEAISNTRNTTYNFTSDKTGQRTKTSVHQGNIGNLTTQQLLKQELDLWKWSYLNSVINDIKEILTIPIYF